MTRPISGDGPIMRTFAPRLRQSTAAGAGELPQIDVGAGQRPPGGRDRGSPPAAADASEEMVIEDGEEGTTADAAATCSRPAAGGYA